MNKPEQSSSGSNAGLVILIAILVLALPCIAGVVVLFGGALFWVSDRHPAPAQPPMMSAPVESEMAPVPKPAEPEPTPPVNESAVEVTPAPAP